MGETRERGGGERRSFRREGETRRSPPMGQSHTATAANDRGWSSSSRVWMCPLQGSWSKGRAGCGPRGTWRSVCGIGGHECPRGEDGVRDSEREPSGIPIRVKPRMGGPAGTGGTRAEDPCGTAHHLPWGDSNRCKEVGPWLLSGRWCRLGLPRAPNATSPLQETKGFVPKLSSGSGQRGGGRGGGNGDKL